MGLLITLIREVFSQPDSRQGFAPRDSTSQISGIKGAGVAPTAEKAGKSKFRMKKSAPGCLRGEKKEKSCDAPSFLAVFQGKWKLVGEGKWW